MLIAISYEHMSEVTDEYENTSYMKSWWPPCQIMKNQLKARRIKVGNLRYCFIEEDNINELIIKISCPNIVAFADIDKDNFDKIVEEKYEAINNGPSDGRYDPYLCKEIADDMADAFTITVSDVVKNTINNSVKTPPWLPNIGDVLKVYPHNSVCEVVDVYKKGKSYHILFRDIHSLDAFDVKQRRDGVFFGVYKI